MWRRRIIGSCECRMRWGEWVGVVVGALPSHPLPTVRSSSPSSLSDVGRRIKGQRLAKKGEEEEVDMEDVLDGFQQKARDHARIPMQAGSIHRSLRSS